MPKPFLTLTTKDFLTGVAPSAHADRGGLFFKAYGVTPLNNPGGTESTDNGLLRGGPTATDYTGSVIVDTPVAAATTYPSGGNAYMYLLGDAGHFYQKQAGLTAPTDLRSGSPISNPANGLGVYQAVGDIQYLYYTMKTAIGRAKNLNTSPVFNDTWQTTALDSTTQHPVHPFLDRLYIGNNNKIASIVDNASSNVTYTSNVLDIPANSLVTALSDDGIYLVIAITDNVSITGSFARTRILFWDTNSSSWQREYPVDDAYIFSLTRIGKVVYAQGTKGIYQVSFSGIKKILSRSTGPGTLTSTMSMGPGLAGSFNQGGYVFAASQYLGTLGVMSDGVPSAFMQPIAPLSNTLKDVSLIVTQFEAGKIYVATNEPKLLAYQFGTTNVGQTGVTAQTVYFHLGAKISVKRIDVIFGEPLASGDALNIQLNTSEQDNAKTFGVGCSYNAAKVQRRVSLYGAFIADEQMSVLVNFTGGVPKIRALEFYGDLMEPNNA